MTGTAKVKPAKDNAEWARNVEKRLGSAEQPTSTRIGDWVLSTQADTGALIASNVNGGSVVLANKPAPSDNADVVAPSGAPFLRVERQATQSDARGSVILVSWDSVTMQTDEWGFVAPGSDVVIPEDGVYLCQYHLAFVNASNVVNEGLFMVDGTTRMAQQYDPSDAWFQSMYMVQSMPLNAGQTITCGVYVSGSGTMDFGAWGGNTSSYTSLALLKLDVN